MIVPIQLFHVAIAATPCLLFRFLWLTFGKRWLFIDKIADKKKLPKRMRSTASKMLSNFTKKIFMTRSEDSGLIKIMNRFCEQIF